MLLIQFFFSMSAWLKPTKSMMNLIVPTISVQSKFSSFSCCSDSLLIIKDLYTLLLHDLERFATISWLSGSLYKFSKNRPNFWLPFLSRTVNWTPSNKLFVTKNRWFWRLEKYRLF